MLTVLDQAAAAAVGQAFPPRVLRPLAVPQSRDPRTRADPTRAIRIGQQRIHVVAAQTIRALPERGEFSVAQTVQSPAPRADPQITLRILGDRAHVLGRKTVAWR